MDKTLALMTKSLKYIQETTIYGSHVSENMAMNIQP